jgi:ankyrin repeat protein
LGIRTNNLSLINSILSKDKNQLLHKNNNGDSLLHIAAKSSNTKAIKLLFKYNVLPNLLNNDLETPLFYAARNNNLDVCKILLDNKAFLEFNNKYGESLLSICDNRTYDYLLFRKHSLNYMNYIRDYPLIHSVVTNNIVLFLQNLNHIEINKKDTNNLSALDYAKMYQYQNFINYIKDFK